MSRGGGDCQVSLSPLDATGKPRSGPSNLEARVGRGRRPATQVGAQLYPLVPTSPPLRTIAQLADRPRLAFSWSSHQDQDRWDDLYMSSSRCSPILLPPIDEAPSLVLGVKVYVRPERTGRAESTKGVRIHVMVVRCQYRSRRAGFVLD